MKIKYNDFKIVTRTPEDDNVEVYVTEINIEDIEDEEDI